MQNLNISAVVLQKLRDKHQVDRREVEQCFMNRAGKLLIDDRAHNRTMPPTRWFIAETNRGRLLKIVFVPVAGEVELKSAFEPNAVELEIYKKHG